MENEKVSIIIPIYNVEPYLDECLGSVFNQTYTNLEVLMIDDGSTDNCKDICKKYVDKDNRFKYFYKENGGLSDARNYGLDRMTGDYIFFLDSDDFIDVDTISEMKKTMGDKNVEIVECGIDTFYEDKDKSCSTDLIEKKCNNIEALSNSLISKNGMVSSCAKLYKKNVFSNCRYKKGCFFEDLFIITELFSKTLFVYYIPKTYYHYRKRKNSITNTVFNIKTLDIIDASDNNYCFIKENYPSIIKSALFRKHFSRLYVLDKAIICTDENSIAITDEMLTYIKTNFISIITDKHLTSLRKAGVVLALISKRIYRSIILIRL